MNQSSGCMVTGTEHITDTFEKDSIIILDYSAEPCIFSFFKKEYFVILYAYSCVNLNEKINKYETTASCEFIQTRQVLRGVYVSAYFLARHSYFLEAMK